MSMSASTSTLTHNEPDSHQYTKERETNDESAGNEVTAAAAKQGLFSEDADTVLHSDESQISFRRSSSLRMPTSTGIASAAQKKIVKFADVLGLDLTNVRTFLQELPSVPKRAYENLKNELDVEVDAEPLCGEESASSSSPLPLCKSLLPKFTMPVEYTDFFDRIRDQCVCLETVRVLESPVHHITGQIKVINLDFSKSVYIRYTLDEWKTYAQVRAAYLDESDHDHPYDKFTFIIYLYDTVAVGQRVEFAIEYHCLGRVYWDNNDGNNYVLECSATSPYTTSYFPCLPSSPTSTSFTPFY